MTTSRFWCLALVALLLASWKSERLAAEEEARGPNFVVIVADDLGWNDVGWHGQRLPTPNLDRLCRAGVELDQHYVSPMCSPTRAALLSGRYASRFGCTGAQNERVFPFDTPTLASVLGNAGYETALCGKWHLGSLPDCGPNRFGFQHSYGSWAGGCGPFDHRYKTGPYTHTWHRNEERISEEGHITDLIAREAVAWLEGRGPRPFFLYVPFTAPHIPIKEPQVWLDRHRDIEEPSGRQYAACVSHLDDAVGRIVAALEKNGQREHTLIVFFSDNGGTTARNDDPKYPPDDYTPGKSDGSNLPLRGHKTQLYEGGIRVCAFANWSGTLKPGKLAAPLHAVDWMPTLCSLAGLEIAAELDWDGQNVWPVLSGAEAAKPRILYWAGTGFRTAAVRDGDWKLIVTRASDKAELFDLANDPLEKNDLASEEPERVKKLRRLLEQLANRDNEAKVGKETP